MATVISQPDVSLSIVAAQTEVPKTPQKVLYVGQKVSSGTATSGELVQNIQNDNSWDTLFGARSMLAGMIRSGRVLNQITQFDAIALDDDGAAVAATSDIVFSGTATADGSLIFYIGSQKDYSFTVPVVNGDTAEELATKLANLINAKTKAPFTQTTLAGTVTLEAANGGTEFNNTGVAVIGSVAGITVTIEAFSGGSGDPDLTNLFDVIQSQRYQTIVWPASYDLSVVKDLLDARFNVRNKIMDGVAVLTKFDTLSNLLTLGNGQNSQSVVIKGEKLETTSNWVGPSIMEIGVIRSSMTAAIRSLRLTQDADISRFVIGAGGPRDVFGSPAIASLPYFNTPYPDLRVSPPNLGFSDNQVEQLHDAGISVDGSNVAGNGVISGEVVTTYKTDSAGNPDISFKYLNYVDTSSNAREYMWNQMKRDFAQSRLTTGDVLPNRNMQNENTIRSAIVGYYSVLAGGDYVLTQAGPEALKFFKENLDVRIILAEGRVETNMKTPLVTQLRTLIGTFQLQFDI
jgi:phage tail sheath gpL-like